MKRTITKIEITEEEGETHTSTSSDSTPGEGVTTFILVVLLVIGLHGFMSRRNQPIIDQRFNSGTIVNEWEGSYER